VIDTLPPRLAARRCVEAAPMLESSLRCWAAGWADLENALAHLTLAARATAGLAAPGYIRARLHDFLDDLDDDALDARADLLERAAQVEWQATR
jgi:hypothetical protein